MSKEVDWGVLHGEGSILCTCDNCGAEENVADFDDGHPDYRQAQGEIEDMGWMSTKVHGVWYDFCSESCRNNFIKNRS